MKRKSIVLIIILCVIIAVILGIFFINRSQQEKRIYEVEQLSEYKYFVLKENNKYGVIDATGKKVIDANYDNVKIPNPSKDVFFCYEGEQTKFLNKNSEVLYTEFESVEPLKLKNISGDLTYEKSVLKYSKNGKYGIINFDGKEITDYIYDEIDTLQYKEGELLVKKNDKYGVINIKGAVLVKVCFDSIESDKYYSTEHNYKKSGYIVRNTTNEGYRYGYIDSEGKQILETNYNEVTRILDNESNDVYIICAENGKYGFFKNGKKLIENEYQSLAYNAENDVFIVLKGKKFGVISSNGDIIVPFNYIQIDITGENIYAHVNDSDINVLDIYGKETNIDKDVVIKDIKDSNFKIYMNTIDDKTLYNIYENNIQKTKNGYLYIEYLYNNYFIASNSEGKLGIIDKDDNIKSEFGNNSIQKLYDVDMVQVVNLDSKITKIYSNDLELISGLENANIEYKDEYIKFYNNKENIYISNNGEKLDSKEVYKNNKIFAKSQDELWGFVDENKNTIVDFKYESVTEVNKYGFAGVKKDGKWGVIDDKGIVIVSNIYELNNVTEDSFIGEYFKVIYGNGEFYYTNNK